MIPMLMITYNRLEFTKKALLALSKSDCGTIFVIDNNSTDGTKEWLGHLSYPSLDYTYYKLKITFNRENIGIAGAMNQFLKLTAEYKIVGKVDNDTLVPVDFVDRMVPHMAKTDIVQAKHPILRETHPGGFHKWVSSMKVDGHLRFNHFVGGSGILFRRELVNEIPETDWKLGGWRQWQKDHPEVRKAFATDVEIKLLDSDKNGANYPKEYESYYQETGRL